MKYQLVPYSVDVVRLRDRVGSGDRNLLSSVERLLREQPDWHGNPRATSDVSFQLIDAVIDLIEGETSNPDAGRTYGHALEVLCESLGRRLPNHHWVGLRWSMLESVGLNGIMGTGPPISLPPIPDFPTIGHLEFHEVSAQLVERPWAQLSLNRHEWRDKAAQFEQWLQTSWNERNGLVLFYY